MQDNSRKTKIRTGVYSLFGTFLLMLCSVLNPINNYLTSLLLIVSSIILYFYIVIFTTNMNWMDIRPVFSLVWMFTIGLASLRLTEYQEVWQVKTWILLGVSYGIFTIGSSYGIILGESLFHRIINQHGVRKWGVISFNEKISGNRVFNVCIITTLMGLLFFVINITLKKELPFFSDNPFAYSEFYTKFHVFSVASTVVSGLCYYAIKRCQLVKWKRIVMYLCIIYLVFLFPILIVSRGVYMTAALSLTTAVFYLNRKRFWILVCCILVLGSVYLYSSNLRNLPDERLNILFEPAEISMPGEINALKSDETHTTSLVLSPKMAFLYGYLTVSHDNFNEAVQNSKELSYGIRQFKPFNVILRLKLPEIEKTYLVREHLNTYNIIGDAYYDFHTPGVIISVSIWSLIFGALQAIYLNSKNPFVLLALGNAVSAVALSFFAPWMSNFVHWMHWGTALLLFLICSVFPKRNQRRTATK